MNLERWKVAVTSPQLNQVLIDGNGYLHVVVMPTIAVDLVLFCRLLVEVLDMRQLADHLIHVCADATYDLKVQGVHTTRPTHIYDSPAL